MSEKTIKDRYVYDDEKDEIGRGGYALVYRGTDHALNRIVAIKRLFVENLEPTVRDCIIDRFSREAKIMAKLEHPHILPIYDLIEGVRVHDQPGKSTPGSDRRDSGYYIVMQYADQKSWDSQIQHSTHGLSASEVIDMGIVMCKALLKVHESGLIHRDVKPHNILLVTEEGKDNPVPKLADFGIARDMSAVSSTSNRAVGSFLYMPPEALTSVLGGNYEADERRDVYGLGATLYEALTKTPPLLTGAASTKDVLQKILYPSAAPQICRNDVPDHLKKTILKSIAPKLEKRYRNMQQMLEDLEKCKRSPDPARRPIGPLWLKVGAIGTAIVVFLLLAFLLSGNGRWNGVFFTPTFTSSPAYAGTLTPSVALTDTPFVTPTVTPSNTPTQTPSNTPAVTPSRTPTVVSSSTATIAPSKTPTATSRNGDSEPSPIPGPRSSPTDPVQPPTRTRSP